MRFRFPWQLVASANERLGWVGGRMRSQAAYRRKLRVMHLEARQQARRQQPAGGFGTFAVQARIRVWMPDRRRRDLTNLAKQPLDALEGVAYDDDVQVEHLVMELMGRASDDPRLEIEVGALGRRE